MFSFSHLYIESYFCQILIKLFIFHLSNGLYIICPYVTIIVFIYMSLFRYIHVTKLPINLLINRNDAI